MTELKMKERRETPSVKIGNVFVGSKHPLVTQAMTLTDTSDVEATVKETIELYEAGSQLVRMTVKDADHARCVVKIKNRLIQLGYDIPLIGDFHFDGWKNLRTVPGCAEALDKYRINPGNVGKFDRSKLEKEDFLSSWLRFTPNDMAQYIDHLSTSFDDPDFRSFIELALSHKTPVRIGVNSGSINAVKGSPGAFITTKLMDENGKLSHSKSDEEIEAISMAMTALVAVSMAKRYGLPGDMMLVSTKSSNISPMVDAYRMFAARSHIGLHVGLTEAGAEMQGAVYTAIAQAKLLMDGIGDTLRTSLSPSPGQARSTEVGIQHSILYHLYPYRKLDHNDYRSKQYHTEIGHAITAYRAYSSAILHVGILESFGQNVDDIKRLGKLMSSVLNSLPENLENDLQKIILQALELMPLDYKITACPGCGRTNRDEFIKLRAAIEERVKLKQAELRSVGIEIKNLKIASMGCVVNGPGEAAKSDLAFVLPGKGENPIVLVYIDGKSVKPIKAQDYDSIRKECLELVDKYIKERYFDPAEVA